MTFINGDLCKTDVKAIRPRESSVNFICGLVDIPVITAVEETECNFSFEMTVNCGPDDVNAE